MQLTQTDPGNGRLVARQTTGYALPHLPEYAVNPANRVLLERLARTPEGPSLRDPAGAWARPSRFGWRPQPLWPELLAGALALFVADVAVRRLRLSRRDLGFLRSVPSFPRFASRRRGLAARLLPARRPRPPAGAPCEQGTMSQTSWSVGLRSPPLVVSRWPQPAWCCSAQS